MILNPAIPDLLTLPGFGRVLRDAIRHWAVSLFGGGAPDPPPPPPPPAPVDDAEADKAAAQERADAARRMGRRRTIIAGRQQGPGQMGTGESSSQPGTKTLLGG